MKKLIKAFTQFFWHIKNVIIKKKDKHPVLNRQEYYARFGIIKEGEEYKVMEEKRDMLLKAYNKAWENRDFEINKFWTRAAYFWGFIVLAFGGYLTLLTGSNTKDAIRMHLDLYLLLLGFLFSITWYLVILGSKNWQRNWEHHIDFLEDYVSGPIYKTIYYSKKGSHSVSKLNEMMAIFVVIVWLGLLIQYIAEHYEFEISSKTDWFSTIAIASAIVFAIILSFGYSSGSYKADEKGFIDRWG